MSDLASASPATADNIRVAGRRLELAPHHCFACGTLNEHGLRLTLHVGIAGREGEGRDRDGPLCWTELVLDRRFEGWEGIAHGGIISTILDEVMAWSLVERELWGLTARLNVAFRRPVPIGRQIRAEGWIAEAGRRLVRTAGRVVDPATGLAFATAEAAYLPAPEDRQRELRERYRFRLVPEPGRPTDDRRHERPVARPERSGELLAERPAGPRERPGQVARR
jgi:acyl-coenzyme A thioesterase PaaI-like protein